MGQIGSFLLYITVILGSTFLSHLAYLKKFKKFKKIIIFLTIFIMAIIAGIRYEVGSDWFQYYSGPELIGNGQYLRDFDKGSYEIGYIILCKIIYLLDLNGSVLLFVYAFLTYYFLFKTIDRYSAYINVPITIFMYGCFYYLVSFNITRQALAISLAMYAISFLDIEHYKKCENKNESMVKKFQHNLKFFVWCFIAFLFHQSAIIAILALPICLLMRKKNTIRNFALIIVAFFVYNFREFTQLAVQLTGSDSFQWYFIGVVGEQGSWIKYILRYLPILIFFWFFYKKTQENHKIFDIYNITLVGLIINSLSVVTGTEIERIGFPFLYFIIIITGFAFQNCSNQLRILRINIKFPDGTTKILKLLLCVFFIWTMWYIFFETGAYEVVPYKTIFGR